MLWCCGYELAHFCLLQDFHGYFSLSFTEFQKSNSFLFDFQLERMYLF